MLIKYIPVLSKSSLLHSPLYIIVIIFLITIFKLINNINKKLKIYILNLYIKLTYQLYTLNQIKSLYNKLEIMIFII